MKGEEVLAIWTDVSGSSGVEEKWARGDRVVINVGCFCRESGHVNISPPFTPVDTGLNIVFKDVGQLVLEVVSRCHRK